MSLYQQIEKAKKEVYTDTIQMSVSELSSMYDEDELIVAPEFQRLFRWDIHQKSNLVESILVGIPIPSVFVFEREDGKWELIDGLQRMSTLLEFQGKLKVDGLVQRPTKLETTKYLSELKNVVWNSDAWNNGVKVEGGNVKELEKSLQLRLKRARIPVEVLKQPSDENAKFELFQRLNRGGKFANEQEVRTCIMVMLDPKFVTDLRELAGSEKFKIVFGINEKQKEEQRDLEYATRCLVSMEENFDISYNDVNSFYTRKITELIDSDKHTKVFHRFREVLDFFHSEFGEEALKPTTEESRRAITFRNIELVFVGVSRNFDRIRKLPKPVEFIKERADILWKKVPDQDFSKSGLRSTQRLGATIPFGEEHFKP